MADSIDDLLKSDFWDRVRAFQQTLPRYTPEEDTSLQDWASQNLSQNAMRNLLTPYLERMGLWKPTPQLPPIDIYARPPTQPQFSVNYMTNYPRLWGR
jgi:hypothetical protein